MKRERAHFENKGEQKCMDVILLFKRVIPSETPLLKRMMARGTEGSQQELAVITGQIRRLLIRAKHNLYSQ